MENKAMLFRLLLMTLIGLRSEFLNGAMSKYPSGDLPVCEKIHTPENPPIKIGDFSKPIHRIKFEQRSHGRPDYIIVEHVQSGQKSYLEERGTDAPLIITTDDSRQEKIGYFHWSSVINHNTGGPYIDIHSNIECRVRQLPWNRAVTPTIHMQCTNKNKVYDFYITRAGKNATLEGEISYPEDFSIHSLGFRNWSIKAIERAYSFCLKERNNQERANALTLSK